MVDLFDIEADAINDRFALVSFCWVWAVVSCIGIVNNDGYTFFECYVGFFL